MRFDHLVLAVADLRRATATLHERTGLVALPGGTHPDWGTHNAIAGLGDAYLELVAVDDAAAAAGSAFGRAVAAGAAEAGDAWTPVGWAVRPADLDAAAARVRVDRRIGRRALPGGGTLSWSMAGVDEALPRGLPFFLRWDDEDAAPLRPRAPHEVDTTGLAWIEVGADADELAAWLGPGHGLDVRVVAGAPRRPLRAAVALRGGGALVV